MFSGVPDSKVLHATSPEVVFSRISKMAAAKPEILLSQLKNNFGDIAYSTVESGIPENIGIELGISLLAHS